MKKMNFVKHFNKSHLFFNAVLFCFAFFAASCSKTVYNSRTEKLKDFAFQEILFNQKKETTLTNPGKYYYNQSLNKFFLRHQLDFNGIRYLFEINNPEFSGAFEASGFYCVVLDNGNWIEKVLSEIGNDFSDDFSVNRPFYYVETENGIELVSSDSVVQRWISSNKRLNSMKFDEEIFVPVKKGNNYILINSSENLTIRSFYSSDFVLERKEFWNITSPVDSKLIQTETYFYDNSRNITRKNIDSEKSSIVTFYNEKKLPSRTDFYIFLGEDNENKYLKSRTLWRYTEDGKISIEEATEFFYENNKFTEFSDKITRRQSYFYKDDKEIPPDYKYYENGKLKMKTIYTTKADYETQIYFDNNFSVKSIYENNVHIKDVYLVDDAVRREKNYE